MKHIVITAGPIPAKLDSVKTVTNKFKGGLAILTAVTLQRSHQVTIIAHESTQIPGEQLTETTRVIRIKDVMDCYKALQETKADTYLLAGAVANLMPSNPWEGKFPSHNYKVGDKFNIEFEIAPRAIDKIREWHPKATLIAYKLFDGTEEELLHAGHETLRESKAHVVFCNHPAWAKTKKIALTQDGAVLPMSFDDHISFIEQTSALKWYSTHYTPIWWQNTRKDELTKIVETLGKRDRNLLLGCAAFRTDGEGTFITTARGKTYASEHVCVDFVGNDLKVHVADGGPLARETKLSKATLNAPTLAKIFENHEEINCILHGHQQLQGVATFPYAFPGTTEEVEIANNIYLTKNPELPPICFNIAGHGYYAGFQSIEAAQLWLGIILIDDNQTGYPNEPIGGENPYYRCCACGISDPQINGRFSGHASDCSWVKEKRTEFKNQTEHQA